VEDGILEKKIKKNRNSKGDTSALSSSVSQPKSLSQAQGYKDASIL
jgi:hypothetical protein